MLGDKYPALATAIGLMQMDNGYCDEGGVEQALARAEAETAGAETREVTAEQLMAAETWCAAQAPQDLDAACCGENNSEEDADPQVCTGIEDNVVQVPLAVSKVLNYLFDNM